MAPLITPDQYLPLLRQFISFDTTSDTGQIAAAELFAQVCREAGGDVEIIADRDAPGAGKDANVLVTFPANVDRPEAAAPYRSADDPNRVGILFSGHLDCVPVTGQDWTTPPFQADERDGKLYGRGTADMTSFLSILASMAPHIAAAERAVPVYFVATFSEETTMRGAAQIVEDLADRGITPAVAIVGEPTEMRAVTAHKSVNSAYVDFRGIAAHSSLPTHGLSAVRYAAEFTSWYHREIVDGFTEGPFDDGFEVPYSTGGVNVIDGGIAFNTIPEDCSVRFEMRTLPTVPAQPVMERCKEHVAHIDAEMKAKLPERLRGTPAGDAVGATLRVNGFFSGLAGEVDGPAALAAASMGVEIQQEKVTYGTEAGYYYEAGIPTVLLGPGSITQAHAADEYIELDQLEQWVRAVETFIGQLG